MKLRRLPGTLRGFLSGGSLWTAGDYLLSVASQRFREDYRRFYFRDIQAIVVTRCPRYVFSTRAAGLTALLLTGCIFAQTRAVSAVILLGGAIAWWMISSQQSCVCRMYTAVSAEALPAIYRVRTARRFLAEVEPLIAAAQAGLPPPPPAGEAAAAAASAPPVVAPGARREAPAVEPAPRRPAERRTAASLLMLFLVLADAAATAADIALGGARLNWLMPVILVAQVAAGLWMILQYRAAALARSALLWGVVFLVYLGGMMYAQTMVAAFDQAKAGRQAGALRQRIPSDETFRQIYIGGCILFAAAGAFVMFRPAAGDER